MNVSAARLIDVKEVSRLTSLGRSTIHRMLDRGKFPKPITLSDAKRTVWLESEVTSWIEQQVEAARAR